MEGQVYFKHEVYVDPVRVDNDYTPMEILSTNILQENDVIIISGEHFKILTIYDGKIIVQNLTDVAISVYKIT